MGTLKIGIEIRDFDLERMGFSLSVLEETKKHQSSEAYLRMTLVELDTFIKALKAAREDIGMAAVEPSGVSKPPTVVPLKSGSGRGRKGESSEDPNLGRDG